MNIYPPQERIYCIRCGCFLGMGTNLVAPPGVEIREVVYRRGELVLHRCPMWAGLREEGDREVASPIE